MSYPTSCPARPTTQASRVLFVAIAACLAGNATGQTLASDTTTTNIDAFTPYASARYTYDSNLYRLDDKAPEIGDRADNMLTLAVGADSDISRGQQRYELGAEINHTLFESHGDLDYTGGRARALWNWSSGSGPDGTLGYAFRRSLRDFTNQSGLERVKDVRTENRIEGSALIPVAGKWRVGIRGDFADIAFSESERLDLQRTTAGLNVGYGSAAGSIIGLDAEFVQGRYDINPAADFDEITVGPTLDWRPTERTRVKARGGYTKRNNLSVMRPDYDDFTGEVVTQFDNQGGRKLDLRVYRDITNLGEETAGYALVNGISVEPSWQVTGAIRARVRAAYEQRDFQVTEDAAERTDKLTSGGVFADWNPRPNLTVTFGSDVGIRSSTRALEDYDFVRAQVQVTARF